MQEVTKFEMFEHERFGQISTAIMEGDKILFKANDVAQALGYVAYQKAIRIHCKGVTILDTPSEGGSQSTKYISESDVYRLVMRSKLPEAEKFQDWVCEDVLPSIRKHGAYMTDKVLEDCIKNPDFAIGLLNSLKDEQHKRIDAEAKTEEQQKVIDVQAEEISELSEKASYVDFVLACPDLIRVTQIAQDYGLSGCKFNKILQDLRIQYKVNGQWILFAEYKDAGYVHSSRETRDGTSFTNTFWTQKGRLFLYHKLKEHGQLPLMERMQKEEKNNLFHDLD